MGTEEQRAAGLVVKRVEWVQAPFRDQLVAVKADMTKRPCSLCVFCTVNYNKDEDCLIAASGCMAYDCAAVGTIVIKEKDLAKYAAHIVAEKLAG